VRACVRACVCVCVCGCVCVTALLSGRLLLCNEVSVTWRVVVVEEEEEKASAAAAVAEVKQRLLRWFGIAVTRMLFV
jgi:hypothetical protein